MYFDASGKHVSKNDMHKSQQIHKYDIMNKTPGRICTGKCIQFKAKKPLTGGRYESGQFRCQTCEIYVTHHGVDGYSCRCCNMRVRGKPRNSKYKEQYHEKARNSQDPWISIDNGDVIEESANYTEINDSKNEKKSAPIYEEIDESIKTYYEFKDFLNSIKLNANYQLVMLKELLEYGELHKGEISESLAYFNNKDTTDIDVVKSYFDVPVYDVLLKHEFIIEDEGAIGLPYYSLNVKLEGLQIDELIDYLTNEILKYNQEHGIPENEFPKSDNMRNFIWSNSSIKNKFGVGKIKNFVKKITPTSTNSFWIWSVTPNNWEIVKSKNVWGSRIPKERIGKKVKSGDQVAFYVIGSTSFKGIFEFVGNWFDSPGKLWDDDLEPDGSLRYRSRINLKSVQLGSVTVSDLYEKMELFIGKPQNICNLVLQGGSGYPSNNSRPLLKKDFEIIKKHLTQNSLTVETVEEQSDSQNVKECPKCHETKIEGYPGIEFDNKIEELFGFRQSDPNYPQSKKPQSYCRQCRSSQNISSTSEQDSTKTGSENGKHVKIFDSKGDTFSIKNCKIESTNIIQKNQILTNDDIVSIFKVGNMGGIRYPKETNIIVLLSTYSDDYDDSIDTDSGLIIYTGEGKDNQELKNGNEKILNSQNTPMVFFKEVYQEPGARPRGALDNKYQFVGTVKYQKHYWKTEKDRKVVKFVLEIQS